MVSSLIGIKAGHEGDIRQADIHRFSRSADVKVKALGQRLNSRTSSQPNTDASRSFSPLRFLCWASLLIGARAQPTAPFPASMNLSALTGQYGFALNGEQADDFSGFSVASAGDVNGDRISDLLIGAYGANSYTGKSYGRNDQTFPR